MNIYEKMNAAIDKIKSSNLKKAGRNTFSKYDYYTPDQVDQLVHEATTGLKLYVKFDLIRNELGISGKLDIINIEKPDDFMVFNMASAIPEIKATNISQQLGGAMTYTKRYMLMNAFCITDNNLDFDTDKKPEKNTKPEDNRKWLNKWNDKDHKKLNLQYYKIINNALDNDKSIEDLKLVFRISKEIEEELKKDFISVSEERDNKLK